MSWSYKHVSKEIKNFLKKSFVSRQLEAIILDFKIQENVFPRPSFHVVLYRLTVLLLLFSLLTATFKQVAKTVTDVNLRDNVVDVVYKMFDENGKPTDFSLLSALTTTTSLLVRIIAWMKMDVRMNKL